VAAILWILKEGTSWRSLDAPNISWQTVYGHFRRWSTSGVWEAAMQLMPWKHDEERLRMVDSTHIKVHRDGANPAGGQQHQAMGRTKGGLNTKLHVSTDRHCQPKSLILTAGSQADVIHAPSLIEDSVGKIAIMDKAYDSNYLREFLEQRGIGACIPSKSNRLVPIAHDDQTYKKRHAVENFFEKIKRCRRVATRYDKTDVSFMAFVYLACCVLALRDQF